MLNQHRLNQHYRVNTGTSVVMAIIWIQPLIQPVVLSELEFIIDGDGKCSVNVGGIGFNIVAGTQFLMSF